MTAGQSGWKDKLFGAFNIYFFWKTPHTRLQLRIVLPSQCACVPNNNLRYIQRTNQCLFPTVPTYQWWTIPIYQSWTYGRLCSCEAGIETVEASLTNLPCSTGTLYLSFQRMCILKYHENPSQHCNLRDKNYAIRIEKLTYWERISEWLILQILVSEWSKDSPTNVRDLTNYFMCRGAEKKHLSVV